MKMETRSAITIAVAFALTAAATTPSWAQLALLGNDFNGVLYDVDATTGAAGNPRSTGVTTLVGISFGPDGVLYGLATFGSNFPNSLVSIDPATGAATVIGDTGLDNIYEGDLDFDPTTGVLYGIQDAANAPSPPRLLFTIDPSTGDATAVGDVGGRGDLSAMAFDSSGTLFVLNTSDDELLTVNKSTAAIVSSVNLSLAIGALAGMDFHPATGTLYVVDGPPGGTNSLYTLNPATGALTFIGSTGLAQGLAGLAFLIPEPGSLSLAAIGAMAVFFRRRRCGSCNCFFSKGANS
jgi:hypothetical protein